MFSFSWEAEHVKQRRGGKSFVVVDGPYDSTIKIEVQEGEVAIKQIPDVPDVDVVEATPYCTCDFEWMLVSGPREHGGMIGDVLFRCVKDLLDGTNDYLRGLKERAEDPGPWSLSELGLECECY